MVDSTGTASPYSWTHGSPASTNVLSNLFCPSEKKFNYNISIRKIVFKFF